MCRTSRSRSTRPAPIGSAPAASSNWRANSGSTSSYFFEGLPLDAPAEQVPLEHGGRQRSAIELVRKFAQIEDPQVRSAIAALVKAIVDRQD